MGCDWLGRRSLGREHVSRGFLGSEHKCEAIFLGRLPLGPLPLGLLPLWPLTSRSSASLLGRRTSGRDWLGRRSLGRKQLSRRYLGNGFRALGICRERGEHHELLDIIKREILSLSLYYDLDAHGAHPLCLHLH